MRPRPLKLVAAVCAIGALAFGAASLASAGQTGQSSAGGYTLDDGEALAGKASISIEQAVSAARTAATGPIGEIDLEHLGGRLVYNVDVGSNDVKVDASDGTVVAVDSDD